MLIVVSWGNVFISPFYTKTKFESTPTAQKRFTDHYSDICLDWHEIHKLPFKVLVDTKSREFQYKSLNRYLITNSFLNRIGLITSPLCTFCEQENESLEHLFIICPYTTSFWLDFICWCNKIDIDLKELSNTDILLGIWQRKEDFLLLNHLLILAKQHTYECSKKCTHPSFGVFTNKINYIFRLEWQITKWRKLKWRKYSLYKALFENGTVLSFLPQR